MSTYTIPIDKEWFDHIKGGRKTIEGKKCSPTYAGIKRGDSVLFVCGNESLMKSVVDTIKIEPSERAIEEYLERIGNHQLATPEKTFEESVNVYKGYWKDKAYEVYGVMGIYLG